MLFLALLNGGAFFMPEKRIFKPFKAFLPLGGIIYHLGKENGLNRKFDKNNFEQKKRPKKTEKSTNFFVLKISKL